MSDRIKPLTFGDPPLTLSFVNVLESSLGAGHGIPDEAIRALSPQLEEATAEYRRMSEGKVYPHGEPARFAQLAEPGSPAQPREVMDAVRQRARTLREEFGHVVFCGIGGSALGPRLLIDVFVGPHGNRRRMRASDSGPTIDVVDTLDPLSIEGLLEAIDLERSHWVFTSLSGTTAETLALFWLMLGMFQERGLLPRRHITVITGAEGDLARAALDLEIERIPLSAGVGGRWSVLTPVGLLPLAVAGGSPDALLSGARSVVESCTSQNIAGNPALLFAGLSSLFIAHGLVNLALISYSEPMVVFGDWAAQLMMESLGKDGRGLTVLAARGSADQHSLLQYWCDGPEDTVVLFVRSRNAGSRLKVPEVVDPDCETAFLAGHPLDRIQETLGRATLQSLVGKARPVMELTLSGETERPLGQLFMFFELAVFYLASLLKVNPFDQPGVQAAKRIARSQLQ